MMYYALASQKKKDAYAAICIGAYLARWNMHAGAFFIILLLHFTFAEYTVYPFVRRAMFKTSDLSIREMPLA